MTALPTRKLEAFRYADIDALASVWSELAQPEKIDIAAQQKLQQIKQQQAERNGSDQGMPLSALALAAATAFEAAGHAGAVIVDHGLQEGSAAAARHPSLCY